MRKENKIKNVPHAIEGIKWRLAGHVVRLDPNR